MKLHNLLKKPIPIVILMFAATGIAHSDNQQRGLEIARAADAMDIGYVDSKADVQMTLTNAAGENASRELTILTLEVNGDGDKSIAIFNSPRDVKGTALLTWSHIDEADEQWLYLPSLSRVKRISSKNQTGSFVGSEFSFEDFSAQEVEKYDYLYLRDEVLDGKNTYVVQRIPNYANSGYSKQILWFDQSNYNTLQLEFYDRSERLLKTLAQSDHRKYQDRFWRPHLMKIVNHQNSKSTTLTWQQYQFDSNLNASFFTKNRLKSLR